MHPTAVPRILSSHVVADRFEVDRFLLRFAGTEWVVSDRTLPADDLGLAPVIYQGERAGAVAAMRAALEEVRSC